MSKPFLILFSALLILGISFVGFSLANRNQQAPRESKIESSSTVLSETEINNDCRITDNLNDQKANLENRSHEIYESSIEFKESLEAEKQKTQAEFEAAIEYNRRLAQYEAMESLNFNLVENLKKYDQDIEDNLKESIEQMREIQLKIDDIEIEIAKLNCS